MATDASSNRTQADAALYAASLHNYAASRLDPFSLRCWIICRLMLDLELEHDAAEKACDHILASVRKAVAEAPARRLERARSRASIVCALREIPQQLRGKCAIPIQRQT